MMQIGDLQPKPQAFPNASPPPLPWPRVFPGL
jgi:hypothetical protein